jgi:hypothetical protein
MMPRASALTVISSKGTDWKQWADRINTAWQKSVEGIIDAGRLLIEAKEDLSHGSFESMVQLSLNFGPRTAQRLMAVAGNPILSNPTHGSHLPPSWRTLSELTRIDKKLGEGTLAKWLGDGTVTPKTERKDIAALLTADKPSSSKSKRKPKRHPRPNYESAETQHDRDLRALRGLWEATCESAREEFRRDGEHVQTMPAPAKGAFIEQLKKLSKSKQVDELFDVFDALNLMLTNDFGVSVATFGKSNAAMRVKH